MSECVCVCVVGSLACIYVMSFVVEGWGSGVTHGSHSPCISSHRQRQAVISVIK